MKSNIIIAITLFLCVLLIFVGYKGFAESRKTETRNSSLNSISIKPSIDPFDPSLEEDLRKTGRDRIIFNAACQGKPEGVLADSLVIEDSAKVNKLKKLPGKKKDDAAQLQSAGPEKPEIDPHDPRLKENLAKPQKPERMHNEVIAQNVRLQSAARYKPEIDPLDPKVLTEIQSNNLNSDKMFQEMDQNKALGQATRQDKFKAIPLTPAKKHYSQAGPSSGRYVADKTNNDSGLSQSTDSKKQGVLNIAPEALKTSRQGLQSDRRFFDTPGAQRQRPQSAILGRPGGGPPSERLPNNVSPKKENTAKANKRKNSSNSPVLAAGNSLIEISYGADTTGFLSETDQEFDGRYVDFYEFTANSGDLVSIEVTSGNFDTYLFLYNSSGDPIKENDNFGSKTCSFIKAILPSSGTYYLAVTSYKSQEVGEYRINLLANQDVNSVRSSTQISYGNLIEGHLNKTDGLGRIRNEVADDYTFSGTAGDTVLIDLMSNGFDTYLYLYDQNGNLVSENDDYSRDDYNTFGSYFWDVSHSFIKYILNSSGTYTIEVTSYYGEIISGDDLIFPPDMYRLALRNKQDVVIERSVTEISYNDSIVGSLGETDGLSRRLDFSFADDYTFSGSAGDYISIIIDTIEEYFIHIYLYSPEGNLIAVSGLSSGSSGSDITYWRDYLLPGKGTYTIEVTSFIGFSFGEYKLTLLKEGDTGPGRSATEITSRSFMTDSLSETDGYSRSSDRYNTYFADDYTFNGSSGDSVAIDLLGNGFETYLRLLDPDGNQVAENNNYAITINSRSFIKYTLLKSGTYTIEVSSVHSEQTGEYKISFHANEDLNRTASISQITSGDTLTDSLSFTDGMSRIKTGNYADFFTFFGSSGDSVGIELTSKKFDTYLVLYDPNGNLLADNEGYGSRSCSFVKYKLQTSGTYIIEVTSYSGNPVGEYRIILMANKEFIQKPSVTEISYNSSINGVLKVSDGPSGQRRGCFADEYTFLGDFSDLLTIDLESKDFDTYLFLYDAAGNLLAENDDYGESSNSSITYNLPASGSYTIEVTSKRQSSIGEYRIKLLSGGSPIPGRPVFEISYGSTISGWLDDNDGMSRRRKGCHAEDYIFTGKSGDIVSIVLDEYGPCMFDSYLYLYDMDGNVLAENNDYGGGIYSSITVTLPANGIYTIEVTSSSNFFASGGCYNITLLANENPIFAYSGTAISYGSTMTGYLSATDSNSRIPIRAGCFADDYIFNGNVGDTVSIDLSSNEFGTFLYLFDPSNRLVTYNDKYPGKSGSYLKHILRSSGTYTIEATSGHNATGEYKIKLLANEDLINDLSILEISSGSVIEGSLTDNDRISLRREACQADQYTFKAGFADSIVIDLTSSAFDTYLYLYDPQGKLVAKNDDYNGNTSCSLIKYWSEHRGYYIIEVTSYNQHATGNYQLAFLVRGEDEPKRSTREISYGEAISGVLNWIDGISRSRTSHFADDYTFSGSAGDTVLITNTSNSFKSYLYLFDEYSNLVAEAYDYGDNSHSSINYVLSSGGPYTIEVTSLLAGETGEYQITLLGGDDLHFKRSVTEISYGGSINGSLDSFDGSSREVSNCYADDYTFSASAGDSVMIDLTSNNFDTYLYFYDPNGNVIAQNDDYGSYSRSLIKQRLPVSGYYTIEVTSYGPKENGEYQIKLLGNENVIPDRSITEISSGSFKNGSLRASDGKSRRRIESFADDYQFVGNAGDSIVLELTSRAFDTYLYLFNNSGRLAASNDDYGSTSRSQIRYMPTSSDTFTIEVTSYGENEQGDYQLGLLSNKDINFERTVKEISYDTEMAGLLSVTDGLSRQRSGSLADDYTFTGSIGDSVIIDLTSKEFDTFLFLYDENGNLLKYCDDYGGISRSLLKIILTSRGTYTIEVTSYSRNEIGEYNIKLLRNVKVEPIGRSIVGIFYGADTTGYLWVTDGSSRFNEQSFADDYTFIGRSGDKVSIELKSNDFSPRFHLIQPNGLEHDYGWAISGRSSTRFYGSCILQMTGEYTIEVSSYEENQTGEYRISLYTVDETRPFMNISYGAEINDSLSVLDQPSRRRRGSFSDDYKLPGINGDTVVIDLWSNDFDTYLYLYDPFGNLVASNDDYGSISKSQITYELFFSVGSYTIEVTSYKRNQIGTYKLEFNKSSASASLNRIQYGTTLSGILSSTDRRSRINTASYADIYNFEGRYGDSVEISMVSNSFTPLLALYDQNGSILRTSAHKDSASFSIIQIKFPLSSVYTLETSSTEANETGLYQIHLNLLGKLSLPLSAPEGLALLRRGWGWDLSGQGSADKSLYLTSLPWNLSLNYKQSDLPYLGAEDSLSVMGFDEVSGGWMPHFIINREKESNIINFEYISYRVTRFAIISGGDITGIPLISPVSLFDIMQLGRFFPLQIMVGYNYPVTNLNKLSFTLHYDSLLVDYIDTEPSGDLDSSSFSLTSSLEPGMVKVKFVNESGESIFGNGTVAEIFFKVREGAVPGTQANFQITDVAAKSSKDSIIDIKIRNKTLTIGNPDNIPGDVDGNKKIDIFDLLTLLKILSGRESLGPRSDVNCDGKIDIFDLLELLKFIARYL